MKTRNMRDLQKHWAEQAKKAAKKVAAQTPAQAEQDKSAADATEKTEPAKKEAPAKRKASAKAQ